MESVVVIKKRNWGLILQLIGALFMVLCIGLGIGEILNININIISATYGDNINSIVSGIIAAIFFIWGIAKS